MHMHDTSDCGAHDQGAGLFKLPMDTSVMDKQSTWSSCKYYLDGPFLFRDCTILLPALAGMVQHVCRNDWDLMENLVRHDFEV